MKQEKTWRDTEYSERAFYALPIWEQRRLLDLGEGQNPGKPSFLSMPKPVIVPRVGQ